MIINDCFYKKHSRQTWKIRKLGGLEYEIRIIGEHGLIETIELEFSKNGCPLNGERVFYYSNQVKQIEMQYLNGEIYRRKKTYYSNGNIHENSTLIVEDVNLHNINAKRDRVQGLGSEGYPYQPVNWDISIYYEDLLEEFWINISNHIGPNAKNARIWIPKLESEIKKKENEQQKFEALYKRYILDMINSSGDQNNSSDGG